MGPCRLCGQPGCFGFGEPGPRSDRRKHGKVWACTEHRAEVEREWQAVFGPRRLAVDDARSVAERPGALGKAREGGEGLPLFSGDAGA